MVRFTEFALDRSVVAECIYRNFFHQVTQQGAVISAEVRAELVEFLTAFNTFVGIVEVPYYRIDAYVQDGVLWILELNASFVDGWGTALNLCRASGGQVELAALTFPEWFTTESSDYLPEMKVFLAELATLGTAGQIVPYQSNPEQATYVYGRVGSVTQKNIRPFDGLRLDNKGNLAKFSRQWQGKYVRVPRHYMSDTDAWEDIPVSAVLKFSDKSSKACAQARTSVLIGKPEGKAKFLRRCYTDGELLAQEYVQPTQHELGNTQLIILAAGSTPVTGYVQFSRKEIINDNSVHGPLWIE